LEPYDIAETSVSKLRRVEGADVVLLHFSSFILPILLLTLFLLEAELSAAHASDCTCFMERLVENEMVLRFAALIVARPVLFAAYVPSHLVIPHKH